MTATDIVVDLRLANSPNIKAKAFADATISLGGDGMLKISGFAVYINGAGKARVAPPVRQGDKRFFDVVSFSGKVRGLVEDAILAEYARQKAGT